MKLLLELLKKILSRLSNSYTKEETDGALSLKIGIEEFDDGLAESSGLRVAGDSALIQKLEANKANDDALANVVKWKTYAIAMQKMVDENLAMQIAEEFDKATVEYLADPTVTKEWVTIKNATEFSTTNPYYDEPPTSPVIDFNVVKATGTSAYNVGSFSGNTNVPVFLPSATSIYSIFAANTVFNSALIASEATIVSLAFANAASFNQPLSFPAAIWCDYLVYNAKKFNSKLNLPNAQNCSKMVRGATSFNQSLSLPKVTNCTDMLYGATSFNSTLELPVATNCSYMLYGATSFNQPLSLPNATSLVCLLQNATSFNSALDLPKANDCASMLRGARSFNQPLSLPSCTHAYFLLNTASSFDNVVLLPSIKNGAGAFTNTKMSAINIAKTLDSIPVFVAGGSARNVITFLNCPGIASTATTETFTVTDGDGTEYSMENCPAFDTDDENQTLRKAFVLAVVKKGWTVEF